MAAPVQQHFRESQLPVIEWNEGPDMRVRSFMKGTDRTFQLLVRENPVYSAQVAIRDLGRCFQRWTNDEEHLSVRMFATEGRRICLVAVHTATQAIGAYSERFTEEEWRERLHQRRPALEWVLSGIITMKRALWIDWRRLDKDATERWKQSHEQGEAGLVRTYRNEETAELIQDRTIFVSHGRLVAHDGAQNAPSWRMVAVVDRGILERVAAELPGEERPRFVGIVLNLDTQRETPARLARDQQDFNLQAFQNYPTKGQLHLVGGDFYELALVSLNNLDIYEQFMPNSRNLREVPHAEIARYVRGTCLAQNGGVQYQEEAIEISTEVYPFQNGLRAPVVHVCIMYSPPFLVKLTQLFCGRFPTLDPAPLPAPFNTLAMAKALLFPGESPLGILEMNRAYNTRTHVRLSLSFDKSLAEIRVGSENPLQLNLEELRNLNQPP